MSSTKRLFYAIYATFYTIKNNHSNTKIPSNPYKIRFLSNSTENHIFNKEITHLKLSIFISKSFKPPVKSILSYYTQSTNNTTLSKSFYHQLPYQTHIENSHQIISRHYHLITSAKPIISYYQSLD